MAEEVHLRQLQHAAETKAVLQLHRYAKADGAPVFGRGQYAAVQDVLQHPRSLCYCVWACDQPQGAADARGAEQLIGALVGLQDEGCMEVVSCVVRADWRGRGGIGRRLVGALLSHPARQEGGKEEELQGKGHGFLMPTATAPPQAASQDVSISQSPAAELRQARPAPSSASTGAGSTDWHAQCWVPPAHPFHNLLCKHMGFEPSPYSHGNARTGSAPGYALPGSQLLVSNGGQEELIRNNEQEKPMSPQKVAVPAHMFGGEGVPTSSGSETSRQGFSSGSSGTNSSAMLPPRSPTSSEELSTTPVSPQALQSASVRSSEAMQPNLQPNLAGQTGPAVDSLVVRAVGFQDVEAVVALHRDAVFQGKPVFGGQGLPAVQAMLELSARGSPDIIGLVAESHVGQILGACTGELETWPAGLAGTGPVLVLLTLVVGEQARRQGVGALLLRALVEEGRARRAACVETDVASINQLAIRLLSKEGFAFKSNPDGSAATGVRRGPDQTSSVHTASRRDGGFGGGAVAAKAPKKGGKKVRAPSGKGGAQPHVPASIEMVLDLRKPALDQAQSSAPYAREGTSGAAQQQEGPPDQGSGSASSAATFTTAAAHGGSRDGSVCIHWGAAAARRRPLTSVRMPRLHSSAMNRLPCPSRSTSKLNAPLRLI